MNFNSVFLLRSRMKDTASIINRKKRSSIFITRSPLALVVGSNDNGKQGGVGPEP